MKKPTEGLADVGRSTNVPVDVPTILILGSDRSQTELLADLLADTGFLCLTARSRSEATEAIRRDPLIGMILADYDCVKSRGTLMHGLEFVDAMKRASPNREFIFVIMDGEVDGTVTELTLGDVAYCKKPISPAKLISIIESHRKPTGDNPTSEIKRLNSLVQNQAQIIQELTQQLGYRKARSKRMELQMDRLITAASVMQYRIGVEEHHDLYALAQYIFGQTAAIQKELGFGQLHSPKVAERSE